MHHADQMWAHADCQLTVLCCCALQDEERFSPARALAEAQPPTGVQKYDFLRSLINETVQGEQRGLVWDMLDRARETGTVTPPKLDPVYAMLQAMQVSTAPSRACLRARRGGRLGAP